MLVSQPSVESLARMPVGDAQTAHAMFVQGEALADQQGLTLARATARAHHVLWARLQWLCVGEFFVCRQLLARRSGAYFGNPIKGLESGDRQGQRAEQMHAGREQSQTIARL